MVAPFLSFLYFPCAITRLRCFSDDNVILFHTFGIFADILQVDIRMIITTNISTLYIQHSATRQTANLVLRTSRRPQLL